MCGVSVVASWKPDADQAVKLDAAIVAMNDCQQHRGPDEQSVWHSDQVTIGHTRLKIIDPDGGHQPRVGATEVLAFNGEIYNYVELRSELITLGCTLRDDSDTEVLAVAFDVWGPEAVERLNGDFAFVVHDVRAGKLTLCRDRLGVKPLHFKVTPQYLLVSSEPKGLFAGERILTRGVSASVLDRVGFLQTLLYGHPVAPRTCFEGVEAVRGGEIVTVDLATREVTRRRYWELSAQQTDPHNATEMVRDLLTDAVRIRMRSDVDHSILLSGGLDSSLIAHLTAKEGRATRAYTIGERRAGEYSEKSNMSGSDLALAEGVAELTGHNLLAFEDLAGSVVEYVRRCTRARDSIVTLANDIPMLKLFERIRGNDTVVLSGEGADEVFLGYFYHLDVSEEPGPYFSSPRAKVAFRLLNRGFSDKRDSDRVARDNFAEIVAHLPAEIRNDRKKLMHYLQVKLTLPFVLNRADSLSASQSLEVRVPYCDHRLVEFVFGLDDHLKFTEPEKKLLRDSFDGFFNSPVLHRRKSVFPFAEDAAQLEELRLEVCRVLAKNKRSGGLVADVYQVRLLYMVCSVRPLFRRFIGSLGSFYAQAFMCQLISLDELEQSYGLRATP